MTDDQSDTVALLREIRDNQRIQLARQAEALEMQRSQYDLARAQIERAERLQGRAEALQGNAGRALKFILWIAIPLLALLLLLLFRPYLSWLFA